MDGNTYEKNIAFEEYVIFMKLCDEIKQILKKAGT